MDNQKGLSDISNELVQKQSDEIIDIFKNIKKILRSKFEKVAKQYGFTEPQLAVIFHLYNTPSITLNELSELISLSKSTVSGIVDRLVKQGVVTREIPEENRRIVKLSISEEFKKNNDICNMKKTIIYDLIFNSIKKTDSEEVEKIIYGLKQFSLILSDDGHE